MPMVTPDLTFDIHGPAVTIAAHVAAAPPRALLWALQVRSVTAGGTNNVAQSGNTDGARGDPVASVTLAATASGHASLTIRDGGVIVARQACDFSPAGNRCVDETAGGRQP